MTTSFSNTISDLNFLTVMKVYLSNGKVFVWDAEDVYALRTEHRIVGSLIGCFPHKPFQNVHKWLPLQLMPEEAMLLMDKGIAQILATPTRAPDPAVIKSFFEKRNNLCREQTILMKENRQKKILEKANEIYEGKKRKYQEMLTGKKSKKKDGGKSKSESKCSSETNVKNMSIAKESVIGLVSVLSDVNAPIENPKEQIPLSNNEMHCDSNIETNCSKMQDSYEVDILKNSQEVSSNCIVNEICSINDSELDKKKILDAELSKVSDVNKDLCMVQLFVECPWKNSVDVEMAGWNFPSTDNDKLRYAVFKDLWEKKYYLTAGAKFGGDFLAYEGDPLKYHALYIIICMPPYRNFQAIDLVIYGRLGNQVKKTVVLASLNEKEDVEYISLNWVPEIE